MFKSDKTIRTIVTMRIILASFVSLSDDTNEHSNFFRDSMGQFQLIAAVT